MNRMSKHRVVLLGATLGILGATHPTAQSEAPDVQAAELLEEEKDLRPLFLSSCALPELEHAQQGRIGSLHDLSIDPRSGRILELVVDVRAAAGGSPELRAIPYTALKWDAEGRALQVSMGRDELLAQAPFETPKAVEGGPLERAQLSDPREASMRAPRWKSALTGKLVHALDGPFGSIEDLFIEPESGVVAFFTLSSQTRKDTPYVLPWRSLVAGEEGRLWIQKSAIDLGEAPLFPSNGAEGLRDEVFREEVYLFYGATVVRFPASVPG